MRYDGMVIQPSRSYQAGQWPKALQRKCFGQRWPAIAEKGAYRISIRRGLIVAALAQLLLCLTALPAWAVVRQVVAAGDIAKDPDGAAGAANNYYKGQAESGSLIVDYIANQGGDKVIAIGDTQYENGVANDYDCTFLPMMPDGADCGSYDDNEATTNGNAWGEFLADTWPVPGNHEYEDPAGDAAGYRSYFGLDADPAVEKTYYSKTLGDWTWFFVDSELCYTDPDRQQKATCRDGSMGSNQYEFFEDEIATYQQASGGLDECIGVVMHDPPFDDDDPAPGYGGSGDGTYGNTDIVAELYQLFDEYAGADLVLSGSSHNYAKWKRLEIVDQNPPTDYDVSQHNNAPKLFTVGTGGVGTTALDNIDPDNNDRAADEGNIQDAIETMGVLRMNLDVDSFETNFTANEAFPNNWSHETTGDPVDTNTFESWNCTNEPSETGSPSD
jgi:hypothetical protein